MDLNNDRQRRLLFTCIAAALVVLGLWLAWPRPDTGRTSEGRATPTASAVAPTQAPVTPPPGISGAVDPEAFDIYRLLPFGRKDFATAAAVAQQFVTAYGTYRYDEDAQTYLARLRPLVNDMVYGDLVKAAADAGVQAQRREVQTVATGGASLNRVRAFGDTSVTFEVAGLQEVASTAGSANESKVWAVTVQSDGGAWRVYAFAPADEGQDGEAQ